MIIIFNKKYSLNFPYLYEYSKAKSSMAVSICPNRAVASVLNVCRFMCPKTPAEVLSQISRKVSLPKILGSCEEGYFRFFSKKNLEKGAVFSI